MARECRDGEDGDDDLALGEWRDPATGRHYHRRNTGYTGQGTQGWPDGKVGKGTHGAHGEAAKGGPGWQGWQG